MSDATTMPEAMAQGEWAIVEILGHRTLVGRIVEVERFGTKMMQIEPLFSGELLEPIFHAGASLYAVTPCSPAVAWARQPRSDYQLPGSIRARLPVPELPPPNVDQDHDDAGAAFDEVDG